MSGPLQVHKFTHSSFCICKVGVPKLIPKHAAALSGRTIFPPLTNPGLRTIQHGKTCPCAFESDSLDSFLKLIPWVGQIALQLCHIPLNGKAHWCKWRVTVTLKTHCLMWRAKMMGVIASVITPGRHNIRKKALHCVFIHNLDCRLMLDTLLLDAGIEIVCHAWRFL